MILEDAQKLTPGNLVTLYEIDCTGIGGAIERYHNHNDGKIVWQGNVYEPWAIEGRDFERTGDGQQPNPTLQVGNIGVDEHGEPMAGVVSALCLALDDLRGAVLTRRRTLAKYLDAANFNRTEEIAFSGPLTASEIFPESQTGPINRIERVDEITIVDGLGSHGLTTQERVNLVRESSKFYKAARSLVHDLDFSQTPSGEFSTRISGGAAFSSITRVTDNILFLQDQTYTISVYGRPCSAEAPRVLLYGPNNIFGTNRQVRVSADGSCVGFNSPDGYGCEHVTDGWLRFWVTVTATETRASSEVRLILGGSPDPEDGWEFFGMQVDEGAAPSKYIRTDGEVRYVRDYDVRGAELVLGDEPLPNSMVSYALLADVNVGNPLANPTEHFADEQWIISQKSHEASDAITFVLSSPLQFDDVQLPTRQVLANLCGCLLMDGPEGGYRGAYCGYMGSAMFDKDGKPVTDPARDKCGGRVSDCKKRFGEWQPLGFGGFPSADRIR